MCKAAWIVFALVLSVVCSATVSAQPAEERLRLYVLLAGHDDAPDPADIVEAWDFSSPPPTPGLAFEIPEATWYFLPRRARGDFLQRLEASPDTPRARLEKYIVVEYAPTVDLKAVTAALLDDTNIEAVTKPVAFDWARASEADRGALLAKSHGPAVLATAPRSKLEASIDPPLDSRFPAFL